MSDVNFRDKASGWKDYACTYTLPEKSLVIPHSEDVFMRAFLTNHILRPSCYSCHFKGDNYYSDITLGDFWNIGNCLPEYDDDRGVSEVIVRTIAGKKLFDSIDGVDKIEVSEKDAYQFSIYTSVDVPSGRSDYFSVLNTHPIWETNDIVFPKPEPKPVDSVPRKWTIGRIVRGVFRRLGIESGRNSSVAGEETSMVADSPIRFVVREKRSDDFEMKKTCCGCTACANSCPVGAISMKRDDEGFSYPAFDMDRCISCGLCERICPILNTDENKTVNLFYAAKNEDDSERLSSSSGGVFTLLARAVIRDGGVVFGARFDDKLNVCHLMIEQESDIALLQGSKYVQSDLKDTYGIAKAKLDDGIAVLFSGTPCQIAGLRAFLRKEYDNLICVDVICHGAPSPMVYEKYIAELGLNSGGGVSFRDKASGWKNFGMRLTWR